MPHYKNFASSEIFERMTKQVAGRALRAGLRRSRVMSVSSEGDPEGGKGPGRVAGVAA